MLQVRGRDRSPDLVKMGVRPAKPGEGVKARLHLADFAEIFYLRLIYDARLL